MNTINQLAGDVLEACKHRDWSLHWTARGAYLHLESSELIEAVRGKRSTVLEEAGDVLFVLMSITQNAGIPFAEVLDACREKTAGLMVKPRYAGEEYETGSIPTTALQASAGVDPRPSLQSIYKAIEDALNSYRMHYTRELPDLDNGLSLVDRLSPDADKDVTRGREELDLLIDHVCGAVGDVFRSTIPTPSEAAQLAAKAIYDDVSDLFAMPTDAEPIITQIAEIISRYCGTGEMK